MATLLYSIYFKSERAYLCKQGHIHRVDNHIVHCDNDESELLLEEFPDSLSENPWESINNVLFKSNPKTSRVKPQLEENDNGTC